MGNTLAENRPDLVLQWSSRNYPVTPEDVSCGSNKKYWWIGSCGHEWDTSVKARTHGENCPICNNTRIIPGVNDLASQYPELAKEWSDKNNELLPTMVGQGSHKKVWWRGKCGHEWQAVIRNRVSGAGCPYCSHNIVLAGFNDLESQFPEVAAEWSERNYPLMPSEVTAFSNRKVWWKCALGHEWSSLISTRSYGSKCPYCSGIKLLKGFNDFATTYPELAMEWSDNNGSFAPSMVNEKSTENVWWTCTECGNEWKSVVKARVKGRRCPVCAERKVKAGYNDLAFLFPEILHEWDYEKNTELSPQTISPHSLRYVWWTCPHGHSYREKISERIFSHKGCKICELEFYRVLPQLLVSVYADRYELPVIMNNTSLLGVLIDAYIPSEKLAFVFTYKHTKLEEGMISVIEVMCRARKIKLVSFPISRDPERMCYEVKEGFRKISLYIRSDSRQDIAEARRKLERIRGD